MWDPSISWDTSTAEMVLSDNTSPACRVCAHCLTWMSSADPKSVSLAWMRASSRSTLSPAEPKQTFKQTGNDWKYSNTLAGLRATATRTIMTRTRKINSEKSRVVHFTRAFFIFYISLPFLSFPCREMTCLTFVSLRTTLTLEDLFFNFWSPDLHTNCNYFQDGLNTLCQLR